MDLFHEIEGAVAIVRLKNGVEKQTKMFRRGDRVFIPHSGGFLRVCSGFENDWGTAHPQVKLVAFEAEGVTLKGGREPRFTGAPAVRVAA